MITINKDHNALLTKLLQECSEFPASTQQSTMLYNFNKLMNILQEKEIAPYADGQEAINGVYDLTRQYGVIAGKIVRSGASEDMLTAYNDLEQRIENQLSGNLYIYAKQWGLSVKALYYYKKKAYDKAFDFTIECIALNEYLIREGVFTLLFRSAEQNRNISRILFRKGDWQAGAALSRDLANYLLNGEPGNLYGKIFEGREFWEAVPYVREGYAYECFRGMVSQMIHFEKDVKGDPPDLFSHLFRDLSFVVDTPDRQILHDWLYLKTLYHAGEYDEFLEEFISFMRDPMSQLYDILKISLFLDVKRLVEKSGFPDKLPLLLQIKHHLDTKLNLLEHYRRDISKNNFVDLV
ncbi:hypothetical protein CLV51_1011641 [Chitinophaga niastensis]|uniref:Uncharacterized protein n=1 Tax=Chitinophaga niastensis TaxID=536980 RepID=A0A2P8HVP6_CHINA|nr:hypothetical protein [Chitinophaga niastensis]PSL50297.1 hypothetical protein CLV51_1011641 [Chitinophaga niastensis]